jgi:transcriptional regulator with XRE-family HTH domain
MQEKELAQTFGRRVRSARDARGWTQSQLADEAHISSKFLSRLEKGHVSPSLFVASRLALALGRRLDQLTATRARGEVEEPQIRQFIALLRGRSPAELGQAKRVLRALFGGKSA